MVRTTQAPRAVEGDPDAPAIRRLFETVFDRYGLDFRAYAYSSIKRRVLRHLLQEEITSINLLQEKIVAEPAEMERLLRALTVHVTAMFRDPTFYITLREKVLPVLRTYPFLRLWVAGCSTGEEVYSLAILLHEEGLYAQCRIYATDLSDVVLNKAKSGIYSLEDMQEYTRNYQKAGGLNSFAEYYTADSRYAILRPFLRENVVFAAHNLTGDASFNEFHGIFCRNVMIYFDRSLQDRVHTLFHESLLTYGYLCLGRSETIRFSVREDSYEAVSGRERIYRKIK